MSAEPLWWPHFDKKGYRLHADDFCPLYNAQLIRTVWLAISQLGIIRVCCIIVLLNSDKHSRLCLCSGRRGQLLKLFSTASSSISIDELLLVTYWHSISPTTFHTVSVWYQWLSARLQYLQCARSGVTAVLHYVLIRRYEHFRQTHELFFTDITIYIILPPLKCHM